MTKHSATGRMGFTFSLNPKNKKDRFVADIIGKLKKVKGYRSALMEGIVIIWELRQGNTDTLISLFPWLPDKFCNPTPPSDNSDKVDRIADAVAERLINKWGTPPNIPDTRDVGLPAMAGLQPAPKQLAGAHIALPLPEPDFDDGATIVLNKVAKGSANGANLLNSMFSVMD